MSGILDKRESAGIWLIRVASFIALFASWALFLEIVFVDGIAPDLSFIFSPPLFPILGASLAAAVLSVTKMYKLAPWLLVFLSVAWVLFEADQYLRGWQDDRSVVLFVVLTNEFGVIARFFNVVLLLTFLMAIAGGYLARDKEKAQKRLDEKQRRAYLLRK